VDKILIFVVLKWWLLQTRETDASFVYIIHIINDRNCCSNLGYSPVHHCCLLMEYHVTVNISATSNIAKQLTYKKSESTRGIKKFCNLVIKN